LGVLCWSLLFWTQLSSKALTLENHQCDISFCLYAGFLLLKMPL
jgi:hypothetical protein